MTPTQGDAAAGPGDSGAPGVIEQLLHRERLLVVASLVAITVLSWAYMVDMTRVPAHQLFMPCCGADFTITFVMWTVMMAGMMVPSAAPMILMYARMARGRRVPLYAGTALFLGGYLIAWTAFSLLAALAQWWLFQSVVYDAREQAIVPWLGGALLVGAGLFQLTPAKEACLTACRSPLGFFMSEWRDGKLGALRMGLKHGLLCIGCCWLLMALLFVVGVMNLLWVAAITVLVVLEKLLPWKRAVVFGTAGTCIAAGGALIIHAVST